MIIHGVLYIDTIFSHFCKHHPANCYAAIECISSKEVEKYYRQQKNAELNQLHCSEAKLCHELNSLQTKLHHAIEDPVTQLQGWGLFEDRVNHCIQESIRYQFIMAILFIDINDFNVINHALGYETGDAVLSIVSQRLQSSIRQVDYVSRYSKDIFGVLLTQLGKPETAAIVAQRMLESLCRTCACQRAYIIHYSEYWDYSVSCRWSRCRSLI